MKSKMFKMFAIAATGLFVVVLGIVALLWFKPHRDVKGAKPFAQVRVADLVKEFSTDFSGANNKYLEKDGNSKVLVVEGRIDRISLNLDGDIVIILKDQGEPVGVSATFFRDQNTALSVLKVGDQLKIKGAITAGNSYDADLDLYEHLVMIKCSVVR